MEGKKTLLKIRAIQIFTAGNSEIAVDLPHLHQVHIEVVAFQPGNPGSSALGSFTVKLHPPGTEGYKAAKPLYDKLDYLNRLEFYDGGKLYYAGIVTQIRKSFGTNPTFELSGASDIVLANLSKPFPGEFLHLNYNSGISTTASYRQARTYFGTNEAGWTDSFRTFTAGNYTSTHLPSLTSGTWSGATDDGFGTASCATGTGAVLISKTGAASGDGYNSNFVEVTGRLYVGGSTDATNAGKVGVGLAQATTTASDSGMVYVQAKYNSGTNNYDLDVYNADYTAGVGGSAVLASNFLTSTADSEGYISFTISIWQYGLNITGASFVAVVNGKTVSAGGGGTPASTGTMYPFLLFEAPATGATTCYISNFVQEVRYSDDQHSGTAAFKPGTIGVPAHSLPLNTPPSPTFLEMWSRVASVEQWYWRYTPAPYVVGIRTLGTIDLTTDPGTDRGTNQTVVYSQALGNLISLELTANSDQFTSGSVSSGPPSVDGGGLAYWRDVGTIVKYGVVDDQLLAGTYPNFHELRRAARGAQSNRVNLSSAGSKTAIVLRDPQTADVWRELDRVMIHCPEMGINYLVARVIGYTFDENNPTQTLTLDQFSADDPNLLSRRMQTSVWQAGATYNTR